MSMTITVDASAAAFANGVNLRVEVLTNAAATQNGAVGSSHTAESAALTTTVIGSRVYGAALNNNTSFTVNGSTTAIDNIADATNGVRYGSCKQKTDTVSTGSETIGYSTSLIDGGIALYEVLPIAGKTLVEDGSAPAVTTNTAGKTATSPGFTPPQGSVLVVLASALTNGAFTISDTRGLTWTKQVFVSTDGTAVVWTAVVPGPNTGDPYLAAIGGWASGTSVTLPVLHDVAAGDVLIVETSTTGGIETAVPTDTGGNTYSSNQTNTASQNSANFKCQVTTPLVAGVDTITCVRSNSTNNGNIIVAGVPNAVASTPVESSTVSKTASGTSTAPTVTSGTLSQAAEIILAAISNANVASAPVWSSPFDQGVLGNEVIAAGATRLSLAWTRTAATTAVTAAGTLPSSATWEVLLTAIKVNTGDTGTGSVAVKKAALAGSGILKDTATGSVRLKKMGVAGSGNPTSLVLSNNFTGLSSGTTLTTGNTGGAQGHAFDAISIPASGTLAADNTHVGIFPMALKAATAGTAGSPSAEWLLASLGTARTKLYFRFDGYKTASASPAWRPFAFRTTGGTHIFSPLISGNALSFSYGSGFTGLTAFTNNTPNGSYFRAEGWIDTAAGSIHAEFYSTQTASTPVETHDYTGLTLGTAIQRIDVGNQNSAASDGPFWLNYVGFSPDGPVSPPAVKLHKLSLAGSGILKDTATGSVRLKKMILAGTAVETEFGTGSVHLKKMGLAGTAKETDKATGSVHLKKMGVAGSGAVFVAGGGSVHLHKMAVAGSGQETDRGTGSVHLKKAALSGSGLPKWIVTGSVALKKMGVAGTAVETEFGTCSVALKKMGVAGSGQETATGTGSVHLKKMGVAGSGVESGTDSGSGSVHLHKMGLVGSGQETDKGTGSVHLKKMGLAASGLEVGSIGSVHLHKMGLSGAGRGTTSGPAHISMKKMNVHGIGRDVGIGSVHLKKMQVEATNKHGHASNLFIFTAV
jgi:hypothetical protein